MSTLKSGNIQHPSLGTPSVVIDGTTGMVTFPNGPSAANPAGQDIYFDEATYPATPVTASINLAAGDYLYECTANYPLTFTLGGNTVTTNPNMSADVLTLSTHQSSISGISWQFHDAPNTEVYKLGACMAYGNGIYAIAEYYTSSTWTSTDATTWTFNSNNDYKFPISMTFGGDYFVKIGKYSSEPISYSTDAINWTYDSTSINVSHESDYDNQKICFDTVHATFMIPSSSSDYLVGDPDIGWTNVTGPWQNSAQVFYAAGRTLVVAYDGSGDYVWSTYDNPLDNTWTKSSPIVITSGGTSTLAYDGEKFWLHSGTQVFSSVDAFTWTNSLAYSIATANINSNGGYVISSNAGFIAVALPAYPSSKVAYSLNYGQDWYVMDIQSKLNEQYSMHASKVINGLFIYKGHNRIYSSSYPVPTTTGFSVLKLSPIIVAN
jgi:hypothetical protein